jgi:hypothetical protein
LTIPTGRLTQLKGLAETAQIRVAKVKGRDYLVVPVVAMVGNSVVRPMNSTGPEFVPEEVLEMYPSTWNGRPLVTSHPVDADGQPVTANSPDVFEAMAFGQMLNTRYEDGRLRTDAYIDVDMAKGVDALGESILARCESGAHIEVSVGAYVYLEQREAEFEGQPYSYIWNGYVTDHLALLPEGVLGACSNKMGCGAPRVMQEDAKMAATEKEQRPGIVDRIFAALGFKSLEFSDRELRNALWEGLRSSVPAFDSVVEVYTESKRVIYTTYNENQVVMYEATYDEKDGKFTFSEGVEVKPSMSYTPVAAEGGGVLVQKAAEAQPVARAACGCGGHVQESADVAQRGAAMSQKVKDLAGRLIANERSPYTDKHQSFLEGLSEAEIEAIAQPYEEKPAVTVAAAAPAPAPVTVKVPTVEEFLASAPPEVRAAVQRSLTHEAQHRTGLIYGLAAAQTEYDEPKLQALSTEQLESLARMLKVGEEPANYGVAVGAFPVTNAPRNAAAVKQALNDPQPWSKALAATKAN